MTSCSSVESTCLKNINQQVSAAFLLKAPTCPELLRNADAFGQLGSNFRIRGVENLDAVEKPKLNRIKLGNSTSPAMSEWNDGDQHLSGENALKAYVLKKNLPNENGNFDPKQPNALSCKTRLDRAAKDSTQVYSQFTHPEVSKPLGLQIQSVFSLSDSNSTEELYNIDEVDTMK